MMTATEINRLSYSVLLADCLQHWQSLAPHIKERKTAQMLALAIEVGLTLLKENSDSKISHTRSVPR